MIFNLCHVLAKWPGTKLEKLKLYKFPKFPKFPRNCHCHFESKWLQNGYEQLIDIDLPR